MPFSAIDLARPRCCTSPGCLHRTPDRERCSSRYTPRAWTRGRSPSARAVMRRLIRARFPRGTGGDFAGRVTAVGSGVHAWHAGDAVWGLMPHFAFGAIADYVTVPEQRLARAPKNLGLLEAAALPVSGTTAMTALTDKAHLAHGERLLVRGATGGVGSIAVQLGKALGAHVTALAGARNLDWVKELGADAALDYRTTRPEDLGRFDVIVDVVGTDLGAYRARLTRRGRMIALAFDPDR